MLPEALSSDACSLVAGADRACRHRRAGAARCARHPCRLLPLADPLRRSAWTTSRWIGIFAGERVRRRTVGRVPALPPARRPPRWQRRRERSGALVVDSEEPEFEFDEHGHVLAVRGREQTESHRLIEHLMIAANEAVAGMLSQRGIPCLYRVHERPDPERVERLAEQLASARGCPRRRCPRSPRIVPVRGRGSTYHAGRRARRRDVKTRRAARAPQRPRTTRRSARSCCARSSRPTTRPANLGHAGLRSTSYCHFTSPIRRYPDLVCHRALLVSSRWRRGRRRAPARLAELGGMDLRTRARRDGSSSATPTTSRAASRSKRLLHERGLERAVRRRDHRPDLSRRVHRLRRARRCDAALRGHASRAAAASAAAGQRRALAPARENRGRSGARRRGERTASATASATGGSSTSRARSCTASAPAPRCVSAGWPGGRGLIQQCLDRHP